MLATGIRTPVGIKVLGPNIEEVERIGLEIEHHVKSIPGNKKRLRGTCTLDIFSTLVSKGRKRPDTASTWKMSRKW
jgi:Cu(I)/Ag(I) efflux system membrane protein CusA/SilA